MIFHGSRLRQLVRHNVTLLILPSFLLLATLSIIRTPFAVPGQQKEFLVNQGNTLARITSGREGFKTITSAPVGPPIYHVVLSRQDARVQYVAAETGLYTWMAAGDTWSRLYAGAVFTVAEAGSSWLIGTPNGLLRSSNQGQSWQAIGLGLPAKVFPLTLAVAPDDSRVVYLSTVQHGLFRSQDGGEHFEPINTGLPPALGAAPVTPAQHIAIDPRDADTVYVSTEVNGVFKTTDGGTSWTSANEGLPGLFPYRTYQPLLAFHPAQANTLYGVIGFPVHSHLIDNKVYKTTDGGGHWVALSQLPDGTMFKSLTIIDNDPVELALGFEGGVIRIKDEGQVIDGGRYWKSSPPPLRIGSAPNIDVGDIAVIQDDGTLNQNFDLQARTMEFTPTDQPGYALASASPAFETDVGAALPLADSASLEVSIPFSFKFYGTAYASVFINSNGNLTFGKGDPDGRPSAAASFATFRLGAARIAAFWDDYDPSLQGGVFVKTATDPSRLIITWNNVRVATLNPLIPDSNTFQVVLLADGRIRFNFGRVVSNLGGLVGLSPGNSRANALTLNWSRDLPQTINNQAALEFFTGRGLDIQATARKFYETHGDVYDQLVVFSSASFRTNMTGSPLALAFHAPVQNDVRGIGQAVGPILGGPPAFGSQGRLQSFLNMNRLSYYPDNPNQVIGANLTPLGAIGHETAHRWLAYMLYDNGNPSFNLLQLDLKHWSFFLNTDASLMYGNRWVDHEDGTFTSTESLTRYFALDDYAMGLRAPEDVNPVFFINQPVDPGGRTRNNIPEVGVTVSGTRTEVSIDQIISQNGPRAPAFGSSPTSLRQAYILIVPEGESPAPGEVEKLDRFRRAFEPFFNQISSQRAVVETRLSPGQPDLIIQANEVNPPMLNPGDTATVNFTIKNQGTSAAGLLLNEIRYSENADIESSDPLLKSVSTVSLGPGESVALAGIPVIVPRTATSGSHFITLSIDAGNAAAESDEMNNQVAMPVTIVGGGITLTPANETEPNDKMSQATPITPDVVVTAELNPARDMDFYTFNAHAGQTLTIDINARSLTPPSPADTVVALFDAAGTQLVENDDFGGSRDSFLSFGVPRTGQYFIRVKSAPRTQGGPGAIYQAVVILRSVGAFSEVEPNDSRDTANQITADVAISGVLNPAGDQDYFTLTAGAGQILSVGIDAQSLVDPSAADTVVSVYDGHGSLIAENDDFGGSTDSFLQVTIPQAGRYYIRVRDVASRGGPNFVYRATIRVVNLRQLPKP